MEYPDPDRTAHVMAGLQQPVLPLRELAARVADAGCEAALERALRSDRRFRIIDPAPAVPQTAGWPPPVRTAYDAAFRRAGLAPGPLVVLVEPPGGGVRSDGNGLIGLLRHSLTRLLAAGADGASAAESAAPVVAALAALMPPAEERSTTPLPPAPAPPSAPRPPPPPTPRPPRSPGSRRG